MDPDAGNEAIGGPLPLDIAIADLRASLRGDVFTESDPEYDARRTVWNATVDKRPVVIACPTGVADVRTLVRFARVQRLAISVRGGGHNVAGSAIADAGVVVDLSAMKRVHIDPERRVAYVDAGATLGDLDHEAQSFGLAAPVGVVSATGIAGLALHGGLGFLSRRFGLTCDNIIGADLVTADGDIVHADLANNADLLWALRGGGGNFGVVTRFELQLHPIGPEVWMCLVMYPLASALEVVRTFRSFVERAPDEFMGLIVLWNTPEGDPIPEANRGLPTCIIAGCWSGPIDRGEEFMRPLRSIMTPLADLSGPFPYTVAQTLFDPEYPPGQRHYWKSLFIDELSDEVILRVARQAAERPSAMTSIDFWALGGALRNEPPGGSSYAQRDKPFLLAYEANWTDPADDTINVEWAREAVREMSAFSTGGVYLNFPGFEDERDGIIAATYGEKLARLRAVKARFDPTNFFRSNINIAPTAATLSPAPERTAKPS